MWYFQKKKKVRRNQKKVVTTPWIITKKKYYYKTENISLGFFFYFPHTHSFQHRMYLISHTFIIISSDILLSTCQESAQQKRNILQFFFSFFFQKKKRTKRSKVLARECNCSVIEHGVCSLGIHFYSDTMISTEEKELVKGRNLNLIMSSWMGFKSLVLVLILRMFLFLAVSLDCPHGCGFILLLLPIIDRFIYLWN